MSTNEQQPHQWHAYPENEPPRVGSYFICVEYGSTRFVTTSDYDGSRFNLICAEGRGIVAWMQLDYPPMYDGPDTYHDQWIESIKRQQQKRDELKQQQHKPWWKFW